MTCFCTYFLFSHKILFLFFTLSCFNYSLLGLYIIYKSNDLNLIYEPFYIFNGYCVLGCTLFYQGIFSFLHDVYGSHFCEIDYYRTLDITFANLNFIYSSYLFFNISKIETYFFISSCIVLFGCSTYLSNKKNNMYVYIHILWHTLPVILAFICIYNSLFFFNASHTLQQKPSLSAVHFSWLGYSVAIH